MTDSHHAGTEEARAAMPMARDAAIEASARTAHEADRALHASRGEPFMPTWADLSPDVRERQVLRAERMLSLSGEVAEDDRFFAAVLRAAAVELGAPAVPAPALHVHAASVHGVDPLDRSALEAIARATAEARGTTLKVLLGNDRTRAVTTVRNLAMLVARRDFRFTVVAIGFFFGGRDHGTVSSNVASMENWLRHDEDLRAARARICGDVRRAGVTPRAHR